MHQTFKKVSTALVFTLLVSLFSSVAAWAAASEKTVKTQQGGYVKISNISEEIKYTDEGAGVGDTLFIAHGPVVVTVHGDEPSASVSFLAEAKLEGDLFDIGESMEEIPVKDNQVTLTKPGYYGGYVIFGSEYSIETVAQFAIQIVSASSTESAVKPGKSPEAPKATEVKTEEKAEAKPADKPAVPSETAAAQPTASKVLVNGKEVAFEAYSINGNNYFKLRDLAQAVTGTEKQFEVGWDAAKNAIGLEAGKAYTPAGGELAASSGTGAQVANPTGSKIYLDGKEVPLTAYNIGGNNYFKLRDIASALNIGITWDGQASLIGIDTKSDYKE
ncbi:hypothetical protein WMW72_09090 [Paenibacillus filicis]|uniref:Copper amine oxidase-like N-terminal domain-containing protein n=1 Tax=Paenibacillus filicis TaxID=669464 RepID=A0ABU9DJ18_9BACL